ncbi:hypothetical protein NQZ68_003848 [Dissostichus eleginoides]|nr:hypothetical protein NQZ68_003848 [Dissostichus eleginoides]
MDGASPSDSADRLDEQRCVRPLDPWLSSPDDLENGSMRRIGAVLSARAGTPLLNVCPSASHLPDYSGISQTARALPGQLGGKRRAFTLVQFCELKYPRPTPSTPSVPPSRHPISLCCVASAAMSSRCGLAPLQSQHWMWFEGCLETPPTSGPNESSSDYRERFFCRWVVFVRTEGAQK